VRSAGKLGDQHKVPRVTNDRRLAEALHGCVADSPSLPELPFVMIS
jgi:hypothetical protein